MQSDHCGARCEHVSLGAPAGAKGTVGSLHLQRGFLNLLHQQVPLRLGVIAVQPGQRRVALHRGQRQLALRLNPLGLALELLRSELAFFKPWNVLHDADAAHGHEVARDTQPVLSIGRQVVNAQLEHRVR